MAGLIQRTDFVSVPVQDMERAKDVVAARRELEGRGVRFTGEHDTGVCDMAFFQDSEGNALMLHRRYAP